MKAENEEIIKDIDKKIKLIKNTNRLLDVLEYVDGKLEMDKFVGVKNGK